MDLERADMVLQCILASAGERQGGDREVTVTQMVKFVYLADAAFAARNGGVTFTLSAWHFTNLGPHAPELEARIVPVARRIGASMRGTAYLLEEDDLGHLRAAVMALPSTVTGAVQSAIRSFSRDTNALLVHVYATAPMRRALPGEPLDFTPEPAAETVVPLGPLAPLAPRVRSALGARRAAGVTPKAHVAAVYAPRYDALYLDGQRALDAAERPLEASSGSLTVAPECWSAPARRERDAP
jgi:hypothetical protein